jgi:hypothetical protein
MIARLANLFAALAVALLLPSFLIAQQDARGTILGRVTDASSAVVAGASVRATNVATGVVAVTKSNEAGNYVLAYLLPGQYTVEAEMQGFKKLVRQNIEVRLGDSVRVELPLEVGAQTETVQVTAETPLLETSDASLGQVVDERRIQELPSFGGAPYNLVLLAAGAMNTTNLRQRYVGTPAAQGYISVDGGGEKNNDFTIDGVPNSMSKGIVFVPPQMSVSEFKVQSLAYDASVGHTAGALVNVSLKSGTNDLHGEAHWFLRNRIFDTATIFQNRSNTKVPPYQDHRYGLSAGGPVDIPGVYNGKNKTFWFYLWEANKVQYNYDYTDSVPTTAMKNGDLSGLLALGSSYQIYDPASTTATANGTYTRQPFSGNLIPTSRLDPVAQKIMGYYPAPNQPGTNQFTNNFFTSYAGPFPVWTHLGRVDHAFSPNHRTYFRVMREGFTSKSNKMFGASSNSDGLDYRQDKWGFAADDVYVFSPSFFMDLRYGMTYRWGWNGGFAQGFDLSTLGFSSKFLSLIGDKTQANLPQVSVSPWTTLEGNMYGETWATLINSTDANFTKLQGRHSIRFGVEMRHTRDFYTNFLWNNTPYLNFDSTYTRGPYNTSSAPAVGGEIASFLLGIPSTSSHMDRNDNYAQQDFYWGFYVHDDFKVSPKLTLNLGLRYELEQPITERYNRSAAQFAYDQANPIQAQAQANYAAGSPIAELPASQFRVMGGLTFAGANGAQRSLWNGDKGMFMPRLGFAYQLQPNTILRGGYGIFFDTIGIAGAYSAIQTGYSMSTPVQASLDSGVTYVASLANPFPNGLLPALGSAGGLSTNLGQSLSFYNQNRQNPYNQRWSFEIQRLLPGQYKLDISYIGNRGTHLGVSRNINSLPLKYLSTSTVRDNQTISYLGQSFSNPLYGTNSIYGKNITRQGLLVPYPEFNNITVTQSTGYSWYHALQFNLEKRFSKGYTLGANYTFQRAMDATALLNGADPVPYRSVAVADRPHRLVLSGIWELPFGHKRQFGSNLPGVANFFVGGWQLNAVMQRQSGAPMQWGDVWTLFTGDSNAVRLSRDVRNVDRWFNTNAGFNKVSNQQLASNVRYSPWRFSNLRYPGQARWDLSVFKEFKTAERLTTQFRAECVNALNHPNLLTPNMTPTSSSFGMITSEDATRTWVMALKLSF